MVTRQIPSGLSSVLFHICKTRFVGWISSLLTYLLGKTFTFAPKSIWNLTFRQLDIFFVDVFIWQNIYGCTKVDMELNGILVDKHLCVYFTFGDAADSSCHLWFQGHTIQEFFLAGFVFFKFNIVCFLSCSALGREVFFFSTCSTNTAQSSAIGSAFTMFSPTEITWPGACVVIVGFPVRIILARLLRVFALWFLWSLHLHLMDIFRFLCSLIHILKLCVRDFGAFRDLDALLQS